MAEGFMIHDQLWARAVGRSDAGQICVGCLEGRLGRRLEPADFTAAPLNHSRFQSKRLRSRIGGE
jgi:hypothetical protein